MKRESGVNPEQTRCCKLRLGTEQIPFATELLLCSNNKELSKQTQRVNLGRRSVLGVSQKTCHQFILVTWLSGNKA